MLKPKYTLIYIILLISALALTFQLKPVKADSVSNSPREWFGQWSNPSYANVSDNSYATESTDNQDEQYWNYSFDDTFADLELFAIDKVEVQCEGYVSQAGNKVLIVVSWNGGVTWGNGYDLVLPLGAGNEALHTIDITGETEWTQEKLNDTNLQVLIHYKVSSGCFPKSTYFLTWNASAEALNKNPYRLKEISKAQVGDLILVSNDWAGIHWQTITEVSEHEGEWQIYDIWSGTVDIKYTDNKKERVYQWKHHGRVTSDHPVTVYRKKQWITVKAEEVLLSDETPHISHEEVELGKNDWIPLNDHFLETLPIDRIDVFNMTGVVYDIKTDNANDHLFMTYISKEVLDELHELETEFGVNLGQYINPIYHQKWTAYVDWLPVKVTYLFQGGEYDFVDNDESNVDGIPNIGGDDSIVKVRDCSTGLYALSESDAQTENETVELWVDGFNTNETAWTEEGNPPYLDAVDYSTNYIWDATDDTHFESDFSFEDATYAYPVLLNDVEVCVYAMNEAGDNGEIEVYVGIGGGYSSVAQFAPVAGSWAWYNFSVYTLFYDFNNWAELNATIARFRGEREGGADNVYIDACLLRVTINDVNYRLDYEFQWVGANYTRNNEVLHIRTGIRGAYTENVSVYAWNVSSSDWHLIFESLGYNYVDNSVDVSPYLNNETFTIRLIDSYQTNDRTLTPFQFSCMYLHTWDEAPVCIPCLFVGLAFVSIIVACLVFSLKYKH